MEENENIEAQGEPIVESAEDREARERATQEQAEATVESGTEPVAETDNETFFVGVDPIVPRANDSDQPLNTQAEVRQLEDLGIIEKMPVDEVEAAAEELDGDAEDDEVSQHDRDIPAVEVQESEAPVVTDGTGAPVEIEPEVESENPDDKNNDGLLDSPKL